MTGFANVLVATLVLSLSPVAAQSTNKSSASDIRGGTITGRVVAQGKPVHEAIVTLWHQVFSRPSQQAIVANASSDADGAYQLTKVPTGSYYIRATAAGYVIGDEYKDDIMAPPRAVYVDSGEQVKGVDFELMRGGVISGRVTDARGQPVIEQTISLIVEPAPTNSVSPMTVPTDDRGFYRFFGVPAGKYKIAAGPVHPLIESFVGHLAYLRTFYPRETDEAKAAIIEVSGGREVANMDMNLGLPVKLFSVSGRVVDGESGKAVSKLSLGIDIYSSNKRVGGVGTSVLTNENGEFRLEYMPAGRYLISAPNRGPFQQTSEKSEPPNVYGDSAQFDVVDADVSGIEIRSTKASSVSGVIVIEGANDKNLLARLPFMSLSGSSMTTPPGLGVGRRGSINSDGSFIVSDLRPGKARLFFGPPVMGAPLPIAYLRTEQNGVTLPREFEIKPGQQIQGLKVIFAYANGSIHGVNKGNGDWRGRCTARLKDNLDVLALAMMDTRGRFLTEHLPSGEYNLTCSASDGSSPTRQWQQQVVVTTDKVSEVTLGSANNQ